MIHTPLILFFAILSGAACFAPGSTNWAEQGFYFDWNNDTNPLPTPITAQCETIDIKWYRGGGTGPDPASPYVLKMYTSHYLYPFIIDAGGGLSTTLPIPFDPGTQLWYVGAWTLCPRINKLLTLFTSNLIIPVICMTDLSGISGGCQDLYTVYPSGNSSCPNVTIPTQTLGVNMQSIDTGGLLSRYGWPASCSDLQFNVTDGVGGVVGTPPYTLTVAPAFRTPLNITFDSSAHWTVTLDHGHPFFVSITDSNGIGWTNGPLHAGAGSLECFSGSSNHSSLSLGVSLGMSFSFLVLGFALALLLAWFIHRCRSVQFAESPTSIQPYIASTLSHESKSSMYRSEREPEHKDRSARRRTPNLHLRRPSNNRASSSDRILMLDRSGVPAATDGVGLAASTTEDVSGSHSSPLPQQTFREGTRRTTTDEARVISYRAIKDAPSSSMPRPRSPTRLNSSSSNLNPSQARRPAEHSPEPRTSTSVPVPGTSSSPPPHSVHRPSITHSQSQQESTHDVYVVHHDAGLPPVTVFTRPGARVTELPPGYDNLIPYPQDNTSVGASTENPAGRRREKHRASSSVSTPLPTPLAARASSNGMVLVNPEDIPLSAASVTPGSRLPLTENAPESVANQDLGSDAGHSE